MFFFVIHEPIYLMNKIRGNLINTTTSSTSCRFHCLTNCTNSGSLVLGAQIVHSNDDDGKLALSLKKTNKQTNFHFPSSLFCSFLSLYPPHIEHTSMPHRSTPHRPYIEPSSTQPTSTLQPPFVSRQFICNDTNLE